MAAVRPRTAAILLTLAAFALRAYGLHHKSFWLDEVDAISMASEPIAQQLRKLTATGENGPLYFVLFKGWIALSGTSEYGARYLSCLASTLCVPLLYVVARRLTRSALIALAAAALGALSPFHVWYAQDAKMYALFAALALTAQYALLRGLEGRRSGWWWVSYTAASSLALYIHLFAALQIAANTVAGATVLLSRRRASRGFVISTGVLVLPYLPLAAWQAPVVLRGARVGYAPTGLPSMLAALGQQLSWHLQTPVSAWLLVALAVVFLAGVWRLLETGWRPLAVLATWLVVPLALVYALQFTVPVFRDRYLIPLLAPLLIACASALALRPHPLAAVAALFLGGSWLYGLAHRPANPDYRAAAHFVGESRAPTERIGFLAEYAERPFNFYYRKAWPPYDKAALPYTNYPGTTEQEALAAVGGALRGGETLWIVRWEDWFWDSRDMTTRFLLNRGAQRALYRDFSGLVVTKWVVP
jgi:4-amino-4-deoxy-L-arabinose transferase-like glycosyltransferase